MFSARLTSSSSSRAVVTNALRTYASKASAHPSPNRVAAGLKAALHNPKVSKEAKDLAAERLEEMSEPPIGMSSSHKNQVLGGYKATLHNPRTSEEAKRHAREILEAEGIQLESPEGVSADEHHKRILAGYKAALHNPRVSDEAKKHAREYLKEHGAL